MHALFCHSEERKRVPIFVPGSPTPGFLDCAAFAQSGMAMSAVVAVIGAEGTSSDEESAPLLPDSDNYAITIWSGEV
jgi:hypothetical protein